MVRTQFNELWLTSCRFFIDNDDLSKVIDQTDNAYIGPTIFDDNHGDDTKKMLTV